MLRRVAAAFLGTGLVFAQAGAQQQFTTNCIVCHGATGEGSSGPDLANAAWQSEVSDADIARAIRDGLRGTAMPAFDGKVDVDAMVKHVRSLASTPVEAADRRWPAPNVNVPVKRLLEADRDGANWLMYGRDYGNQRFSPLKKIHKGNVTSLVPAWSFQTGTPDGLQATPLLVDGVMYLSTSWNHVFAIDASTGREIWHYRRRLPEKLKYCCGPVNRGVAIRDSLVYLATLDAHLVALDARTGRVRWDVEMGKVTDNLSATTAPLIAGGKVVVGMAGGDFPSRGFIDAYDAVSGARAWRFYTIPGEGEKGAETWGGSAYKSGGAATWMNGSFDPELNLIYWGTGNPFPVYDGDARPGDNLYANAVVAVDASTGQLKWHYQFTPHDVWDYDGVNEMVFADVKWKGRTVKALLHADRNGHLFALARADGEFLYAKPFVRVNWAKGFDAKGRPIVDPAKIPSYEGTEVCPGAAGGKEWNASSYYPALDLLFVPVIENCAMFYNYGVRAKEKGLPPGPSGFKYLPGKAYGKLMAIRGSTGEPAWESRLRTPGGAGTLATAGGIVFFGDAEGNFSAWDAERGKELWSYQTGSGIRAAPITYELGGRQYVAIATGMAGAVGGYTGAGAPWMRNYRSGATLYVFALFEPGLGRQFHGGAVSPK